MIEIELFDGTVLEFPQGTSQAVLDRVAKQETALRRGPLREAAGTPTAGYNVPERTMGQNIYENLIGSGAVDTPGERAGELVRGLGAGAMRGASQLAGLPGTIVDLLQMPAQKLGLMAEDVPGGLPSGAELQQGLAAATGGASEYVAPGRLGGYAGTIGEFLPGGVGGGIKSALKYAVAPAITSEAAGQLAQETIPALEPVARIGAALATPLALSRPGAFAGGSEGARQANVLREAGIRDISAGQASGSQGLMRAEGMLEPTGRQLDEYTAAVLRRFGSTEKIATPQNLRSIETNLVTQMDDAVRGVDIIPDLTQANRAVKVATDYVQRVPAGQLTPRMAGIAKEIEALAKSGRVVPLSRLKEWRSDIGKLTVSPDAATRDAAHSLRGLIDDMTDTALTTANRADDISKLATAREAYRDYIGLRDAASRVERGILSPQALNQSMIRAQGRESYATGRSTPMTDFTRSGASVLRPAPSVSAGGRRSISEVVPMAAAGLGAAGALGAGMGPIGAALGVASGALAPVASQMAMRSAPVQAFLRDPAGSLARLSRTFPGLLAD